MLALGANAVLKSVIAAPAGGLKFALGLLLPFIVWGASVGVGLWVALR